MTHYNTGFQNDFWTTNFWNISLKLGDNTGIPALLTQLRSEDYGGNLWHYFVSIVDNIIINISTFPFIIQVSIIFIIINIIMGLTIGVSTVRLRRSLKNRETIIKELQEDMIKFFKNILNKKEEMPQEDIHDSFVDQFGKLNKKTYISIAASLEKIVKEDRSVIKSPNYYPIVNALKLIGYFEGRLNFSNTRTKLRIFQTMSELELTISDSKILPFTYSKDNFLKNESRISYVGVSKNEPFKFFEQEAGNRLNQWAQISLLKQFETHHADRLPDFGKWIKYTKDDTQKQFCIRMVGHFDQKESVSILIELLTDNNEKVRREAILALGKMQIEKAEENFREMYYYEPLECQNAIIESITRIRSGKALDFLKDVYKKGGNSDTKRMIAEVIYYYSDEARNYFNQQLDKAEGFEKLILKHAKNPIIDSNIKRIIAETDHPKKNELTFANKRSDAQQSAKEKKLM
ncbi:MAG: HEAT repeat domain-containing protein [Cryomorphaceae bacterium]|nr:HEAT repeat domain-containing protein [Cryomorphaceae bacterium]